MNLPKANKELGQHFLTDKTIIEKICKDFSDLATHLVEVGPGPAILTHHLHQYDLPYFVVEKDTRFTNYLKQFLNDDDIFFDDALEFDFESELSKRSYENTWLVSNLPYNVSAPLTIRFLQMENIKYMTLMYQKEVAEKIVAFNESKKNVMNSLMALCQTYFDVKLLSKVPAGAFSPPPKIDSAVISYVRKENPIIALDEFLKFETFLRNLFQHKRKQMGKVLKMHYESDLVQSSLEQLELSPTLRAETLSLSKVHGLYRKLVII